MNEINHNSTLGVRFKAFRFSLSHTLSHSLSLSVCLSVCLSLCFCLSLSLCLCLSFSLFFSKFDSDCGVHFDVFRSRLGTQKLRN